MGEIAEMVLNGILCQICGQYIDDDYTYGDPGYPRECKDCERRE